jgi:hypothetical protein
MHCTICTRALPADTDRYACPACEHEMRSALEQLLVELPALRASLALGSPAGGRRPVGRAHSPMPVTLRVLDLLGPGTVAYCPDPHGEQTAGIPLGPLVISWCQHIAHDYPAVSRRGGTEYREPCTAAYVRRHYDLPTWIVWLTRYLPYATTRPWAGELHDALDDALQRVRQVTGNRPQSHARLAPCPQCDAFAMTRTDGQWDTVCEACGYRMDPDAYASHASRVLPALTATAVRIAAAEVTCGAA